MIGLLIFGTALNAQEYKTAAGVRLSSSDAIVNNSITFKQFLNGGTAVEVLFCFSDPVALGALVEKHNDLGPAGLKWFYGGGAYVGFGGDKIVGGQGILGLDYKWTGVPINISLDWKPELNIVKVVSFEPAALAFSIRFTFK